MAECTKCGRELVASEIEAGICYPCTQRPTNADLVADVERKRREAARAKEREIATLMLTTEACPGGLIVKRRIDVITAEAALGMNVFRDFFAGIRDLVGGPSGSTQKVLRDAREMVLQQLRKEAHALGANAVIGVSLNYSEFSGGGKSMLFVVGVGTAVEVEKPESA